MRAWRGVDMEVVVRVWWLSVLVGILVRQRDRAPRAGQVEPFKTASVTVAGFAAGALVALV